MKNSRYVNSWESTVYRGKKETKRSKVKQNSRNNEEKSKLNISMFIKF